MRLCAVSVDLDEIPNYFHIHGLGVPADAATAVYDRALGRLSDLSDALHIPLTLFAIASDLNRAESATRLRAASDRGHEVANHSLNHFYDLSRRPRLEMERQVVVAADKIEVVTGQRPVGFRARQRLDHASALHFVVILVNDPMFRRDVAVGQKTGKRLRDGVTE